MKCQHCDFILPDEAKFCERCGKKQETPVAEPEAPVIEPKTPAHDVYSVWPEWIIENPEPLGKGSYGVVYEAIRRDNNVESRSAIKVISIPSDASEINILRSEGLEADDTRAFFKNVVDDFVSEIQLMQSLKGVQNIVSVEDYKVIEKTDTIGWEIYIRMELLTPFNNYLHNKQLSEKDIIKIGCDICSALEICEQRRVIHRDVKPENIFVNDFGHFKLGDFGIARKLENLSGGLSQKGTVNYMAPEVATSSDYDARVDTYSLGIVLYRLLNGNRLPFIDNEKQLLNPHDRKAAVERRIRGEALPAPCNASPSMADVILRACAFDPEARFASPTDMKHALESVANGTYQPANDDLDKTTSVRSAKGANDDATTAVRKAPPSSGKVDTFGDEPKKTLSKGKKAKIIAIAVLAGIVAVAVLLAVLFFTGPSYSVFTKMNDEQFGDALETYRDEVKGNFIHEPLLSALLGDRVSSVADDYENGETDYDTAVEALNALEEMNLENASEKRTQIMASYADNTVSKYDSGALSYEEAKRVLTGIQNDGYAEAGALIDKITASQNAATALKQADEFYEKGDYENAISEYSKVPENDENYTEAQDKLTQVYADYIRSTVETARAHNAAKNHKQAVAAVTAAYRILPSSVDTAELNVVKEESLAAYKTQVTDEVSSLTESNDWTQAFSLIDDAISFDNNEYFQTLKTSTEGDYVKSVTAMVQKHLDNEDYISAKRVADNSLTVLSGNADLKALQAKVVKATPTYLLDVCTPYETSGYKGYVNGELIRMAGKEYTNAFTLNNGYALFNFNSQYTTLSFTVGHVDGKEMRATTVKVYCDGILKKELAINADALPQRLALDVTGVNQVKIESSQYWTEYGFANITVK